MSHSATTFLSGAGDSVTRDPCLAILPHYPQSFVTPDNNGGPSSHIKNALSAASQPRLEGVIHGKPATVIAAAARSPAEIGECA